MVRSIALTAAALTVGAIMVTGVTRAFISASAVHVTDPTSEDLAGNSECNSSDHANHGTCCRSHTGFGVDPSVVRRGCWFRHWLSGHWFWSWARNRLRPLH